MTLLQVGYDEGEIVPDLWVACNHVRNACIDLRPKRRLVDDPRAGARLPLLPFPLRPSPLAVALAVATMTTPTPSVSVVAPLPVLPPPLPGPGVHCPCDPRQPVLPLELMGEADPIAIEAGEQIISEMAPSLSSVWAGRLVLRATLYLIRLLRSAKGSLLELWLACSGTAGLECGHKGK